MTPCRCSAPSERAFTFVSLLLTLGGLLVALKFDLLVALMAACASYALAHALPKTWLFRRAGHRALLAASFAVAVIPVLVLVTAGALLAYYSSHATSAYAEVLQELTRVIAQWRAKLPASLADYLPSGPETVKPWLASVVKSQADKLTGLGKSSAHGLLMTLVGVVIGLLLANSTPHPERGPLSAAIAARAARLQAAFSAIVSAQFWIAAINTGLTAAFFYLVLPLFGASMPYAEGLLVLTFFAGMLPVAGNLLCNTVITVISLSIGPVVAASCLAFLIVVHKLEYVVNAKVVGHRMSMTAWELLTAMFAMEAVFGIAGLVSAPLFYAYLKSELRELHWV